MTITEIAFYWIAIVGGTAFVFALLGAIASLLSGLSDAD